LIDPAPVKVQRHRTAMKLLGPIAAVIDHEAAVSVPSTGKVGAVRDFAAFSGRFLGIGPALVFGKMKVVGRLFDGLPRVWVKVRAG